MKFSVKLRGETTKFNPKSIMVDENVANYCAIRRSLAWNLQHLK